MILSRRASFCNFELDEVDDSIVIQSMDPGTPPESAVTADKWGGFGARLVSCSYGTLEAAVTFGIDIPKTEQKKRRKVYDAVMGWAKQSGGKGWLVFNYMNDRRLYVDRTAVETSGDIRDWTAQYTVHFYAHHVPFWESKKGDTWINGSKGEGSKVAAGRDPFSLAVEGTAPCQLNIEYRNDSGKTMNDVKVVAGDCEMHFNGVNLVADESLMIDHTAQGILRARAVKWNAKRTKTTASRNVYPLLTGSDDLIVEPGFIEVDVKGSVSGYEKTGRLWVDAYARWL